MIAQSPEWSVYYAENVIHGRWEEGEGAIMGSTYWSLQYAKRVIKRKLPRAMNNRMILYAHDDPHAKQYLQTKRFQTYG